ncbi:hypothetical protein Patl1_21957 [Pistacia atlantica]|uniref:Uncharacterized protein n=1 Tax=Pistacia atlantica TaxID=434234 RepID=A0ACC1BJ90_9ROSI|nr:hypothetical protein Patl1_21957 [Pistacia atlantica]
MRYVGASLLYLHGEKLSHIEGIKVTDYKKLKEFFAEALADHVHQTESNRKVEFTQLHYLKLKCLPQLKSFGFNVETNVSRK